MRRDATFVALLLASAAFVRPAFAQSESLPRFNQIDGNGVDLVTGDVFFSIVEGRIGTGVGELALVRNWAGPVGWTDNWSGVLYTRTVGGSPLVFVEFGTYSDTFTISGTAYVTTKTNGATLVATGHGQFRYTAGDGTRIDFTAVSGASAYPVKGPLCQRADDGSCAVPIEIVRPDGLTYSLQWDEEERCFQFDQQLSCTDPAAYVRFRGVTSSANYAIAINYAADMPGSTGVPLSDWFRRSGASFDNADSPISSPPAVSYATVSSSVFDVTDIGGQTWRFTNGNAGRLTAVRRPGAVTDTLTFTYSTNALTVVNGGITTGYTFDGGVSGQMTTITDAASQATEVETDSERIISVRDPLGRTTGYDYDSSGRLERVTRPEGNSIQNVYDARGNVTETRAIAKSGSGLPDMVTTASYDETCTNVVTCNSPNSITDARGHITEFTYDSTHGGLVTVTAPAPSSGADRPQTRYSYTQVTAVTGQPVYMLTEMSACASGTSSTCVGTASEARTVTAYDTDNLRVASVTSRNGNNSISATSSFAFDAVGNLLTVDGPLSGSADTTYFRYDSARRGIGTVSPDPDGSGSLPRLAERRTYANGLLTKVESGNVAGPSDTDWANFAPSRRTEQDYDANARPTVARLMSGSTTYALSQTSYDSLGRVQCVAQRMNPAEFATSSLPSDACTLDAEGTDDNAFGADRITRNYYDAAGQVTQVRTAYGVTGQEANAATLTYRSNGQIETLTDAESNRTTYVYDGHDRLSRTRMPSPGTDDTSSETDYGELTYATASVGGNTVSTPLVASVRLRDASSIDLAYDNLGRLTQKTVPERSGLDGSHTRDVYYAYDLLGRLTEARFGSLSGSGVSNSWDALGRLASTSTNMDGTARALSYQYDAAGRRTRITHPDSAYFVYDRDVLGRLIGIDENGSSDIQNQSYYATGELYLDGRAGSARGWLYDDVGRPTYQIDDLPSSAGTNWTLARNPAGQVVSNVRSNDDYAWGGHYQVNRAYTADGLNRYTQAASGGGTTSFSYDANGNLSGDGTNGWTYDRESRLVASSAGPVLTYDPLGRLYQVTSGSNTTRFLWDDWTLVAEYDGSGAITERYVHGDSGDNPIFWYHGSSVGSTNRRQLYADPLGSIVAITDAAGNRTNVNSYDEYGIPASGNTGRFQYTGQIWLPELGMQYSRNRIYSPTMGRFMQTDPIGVAGGINLYGYVGNEPVNRRDPLGLNCEDIDEQNAVVCGERNGTETEVTDVTVDECDIGRFWDADPRHQMMCIMGTGRGFLTYSAGRAGSSGGGSGRPTSRPEREICPVIPASRPIGNWGRWTVALADPEGASQAYGIGQTAIREANSRFPTQANTDGTMANAYRHFYWVYHMTLALGAEKARRFANANEVSGANSARHVRMDTWNNETAIRSALDPRNRGLSAAQAAEQALRNGCLRWLP